MRNANPYTEHRGHPGRWRLEAHCGDCGAVTTIGKPRVVRGDAVAAEERRPLCTGLFMGRPRNRCGFVLSYVWIFYPANKT